MLSRRQLRIKVLQALYAFFQSKENRIDIAEKQLLKSIEKLYELYIFQLSFILEIFEFAEKRIGEAKNKFLPTESDLNPNTKFINNKFLKQLSENKDLLKKINDLKISWSDEENLIRKTFLKISESKKYKDYMSSFENSYHSDKEIVIKLIKKEISENEVLKNYYENRSIYWVDDYYTVTMLIIKTIKLFQEDWDEFVPLPLIYKTSDKENNEDRKFIIELFRKTIIHSREYEQLIDKKTKNWELDRIAIMDIILIKMALAEILEFPNIPVKVTMNEYIELSKLYSTPKSKIFVNGILDKLIVDLKEKNIIKKTGRGLME
jgi:N utilization substance protein B